jgi:hypothetical protein
MAESERERGRERERGLRRKPRLSLSERRAYIEYYIDGCSRINKARRGHITACVTIRSIRCYILRPSSSSARLGSGDSQPRSPDREEITPDGREREGGRRGIIFLLPFDYVTRLRPLRVLSPSLSLSRPARSGGRREMYGSLGYNEGSTLLHSRPRFFTRNASPSRAEMP